MKKVMCYMFVLLVFFTKYNVSVHASDLELNYPASVIEAKKVFDISKVTKGIISVNYKPIDKVRYKVMISKDYSDYVYDLNVSENNTFPLQLGDGEYVIEIFRQRAGTQYDSILYMEVNVKLENENITFLQSSQNVNWNKSKASAIKAKELTKDAKTDRAKFNVIYNYITTTVKYDYGKLGKLPTTYVPSIDSTFLTKKGICYDFSSLLASMLRSVGVPTKLIKGYAVNVSGYHAWNEVYLGNKWEIVDTTYDAPRLKSVTSFKLSTLYRKTKEY